MRTQSPFAPDPRQLQPKIQPLPFSRIFFPEDLFPGGEMALTFTSPSAGTLTTEPELSSSLENETSGGSEGRFGANN